MWVARPPPSAFLYPNLCCPTPGNVQRSFRSQRVVILIEAGLCPVETTPAVTKGLKQEESFLWGLALAPSAPVAPSGVFPHCFP